MITAKGIELENVSVRVFKSSSLFVNILTDNDKYSLVNRDNLRQHIQMELSQKQKNFF